MSNTSDQLGKQAKEVAEDLRSACNTVREAAQAELGQVSDGAADYGAQMHSEVHGMACACEQFIRQQPLRSVLMAAGIGWLLGRFWKRG